jgi:hypothetical protein
MPPTSEKMAFVVVHFIVIPAKEPRLPRYSHTSVPPGIWASPMPCANKQYRSVLSPVLGLDLRVSWKLLLLHFGGASAHRKSNIPKNTVLWGSHYCTKRPHAGELINPADSKNQSPQSPTPAELQSTAALTSHPCEWVILEVDPSNPVWPSQLILCGAKTSPNQIILQK